MVECFDPHILGITESWANTDITYAELGLRGYVMFRKDRIGRRGGGVILYVKESIQAYEIKLERGADCDEAVRCEIVSGNEKLTIGLVYRSPNINEKRECSRGSFQKDLVDNAKMHEPLGNSNHNQMHFDINVRSEIKNKKRIGEISTKVTIKI